MMGHKVSHAKNRTNHAFKPNLQNKKIEVEGRKISVKICTNCIKLMKKITKDKLAKIALKQAQLDTQSQTPLITP